MSSERLIYLPLGGAGEIGMNAYVYGYGKPDAERLILVDLGVTFPDMDGTPGVDLILPDIAWLRERRDRLDAIFVTHAHEDHVGAVAHYYGDLGAPVSITSPELSGMECEMGTKPTVKGPASTVSGQAETMRTALSGWPCSSILRRAIFAVKARA